MYVCSVSYANACQMDAKLFQLYFLTCFFIVITIPICISDDKQYEECRSSLYECGEFKGIAYPFYGDARPQFCGIQGFELKCQAGGYPLITIDSLEFRVLNINLPTYNMTIARTDFWNETCPQKFNSTTLNYTLFDYSGTNRNLTLFYGCSDETLSQLPATWNVTKRSFTCEIEGDDNTTAFYVEEASLGLDYSPILETCENTVTLPVRTDALAELLQENTAGDEVSGGDRLEKALNMGFDVNYGAVKGLCAACNGSGGICGSSDSSPFNCFCPDDNKSYPLVCPSPRSESQNISRKIIMAIGGGGVGILFVIILIIFTFKRKTIEHRLMLRSHANQNIEEFVRNCGSQALKRYSYSDIKRMTSSFKDKLGQGGYGSVFKGKLGDGRLVAVKLLNTSKGNGEEFINEVASISRTSHVNIVSLLGFCFECGKKALIYEFMSNGSLENFLCSESTPLKASKHLGWEKLYQIAVGIARGLDYLHCGCKTKILHFDVKPHNILLDLDFTPKISDFGLAKLCPPKESLVSMSAARGTIGYVAPEVFCRNFGRVSHKSDVYSYGMMILEMVGGRLNVNGAVNNTSETYFPHWIYKNLERQEDLGLESIENKEENEVTTKMIVVGLWCIQTDPSHRPCMSKVIEMLEGSIEALQIPPKPFLSSPPRSPLESSSFKSTLS